MTIDVDGVLCRPPTWFNLAISRDVSRHPETEPWTPRSTTVLQRTIVQRVVHGLRWAWRLPMPGAAEGLAELQSMRRLVLLSGRTTEGRASTEAWLRRHGLAPFFSDICLNHTSLSNAGFKLKIARERRVAEHVDDDGRVAYFLSRNGLHRVYLIAWRRNAGLPYPDNVVRVANLSDVARVLAGSPVR